MRKLLSIAGFTLIASALTFAHVTVAPQQAPAGASQVYKVRVHNDEKTAVSSIELDIPAGGERRVDGGGKIVHGKNGRPHHQNYVGAAGRPWQVRRNPVHGKKSNERATAVDRPRAFRRRQSCGVERQSRRRRQSVGDEDCRGGSCSGREVTIANCAR